jgi:tetratricopeptide (TPR) repeat protein
MWCWARRLGQIALTTLALCSAAPVFAETVVLDAPNLRRVAFEAVQAGFAQDALEITDALLVRDPADSTALAIRSRALRALGRYPEAISDARAAWRSADTDQGRFGAAMAMAQAQSSAGNRTIAQLWLRRAANNAPNERALALARRDFGYVRSRNPWRFVLDFSAAPSSNVNNGSRQDRLSVVGLPIFFDIPPESQALSGLQYGLGLTTTYRFSPTGPNRQTSLKFGALVQAVTLSPAAKEEAPAARASDYTLTTLEFGANHSRALDAEGRTMLNLTGTFGHNWYAGNALSDYVRLDTTLTRAVGPNGTLTYGLSADHVRRIDRPLQSSHRIEVSTGYQMGIGAGREDTLSFELKGIAVGSSSAEVRNTAVALEIGWKKAAPIAGIELAAGLTLEQRVFADSRYAVGGREDTKLSANVQMTFTQIEYFGFSPVLSIQATRNRSNAALYDSETAGVTLGIASTF